MIDLIWNDYACGDAALFFLIQMMMNMNQKKSLDRGQYDLNDVFYLLCDHCSCRNFLYDCLYDGLLYHLFYQHVYHHVDPYLFLVLDLDLDHGHGSDHIAANRRVVDYHAFCLHAFLFHLKITPVKKSHVFTLSDETRTLLTAWDGGMEEAKWT